MSEDAAVAAPPLMRKLIYLSGVETATEYRPWLTALINAEPSTGRNMLLALPNAAMLGAAGAATLAFGNSVLALVMMVGAVGTFLVGMASDSIATRRAEWLAERNNIRLTGK